MLDREHGISKEWLRVIRGLSYTSFADSSIQNDQLKVQHIIVGMKRTTVWRFFALVVGSSPANDRL